MCVIVIKEKDQPIPERSFLEECFQDNPDGAGFMYAQDGSVRVSKGYMDFDSFYGALMECGLEEQTVVFHFRLASCGTICPEACHPFEIAEDLAFCHNGGIRAYESDDGKSDTWHFGEEVLKPLYKMDPRFYESGNMKKMLEVLVGEKFSLCLMDGNGDLVLVGHFEPYAGYLCSNLHFTPEFRKRERAFTEKYHHLTEVPLNAKQAETICLGLTGKKVKAIAECTRYSLWKLEGEPVAVSGIFHEPEDRSTAWLALLEVAEPYQRQKVGSQVLEEFFSWCRWNRVQKGRIRTKPEGSAAIPFCLSNGMTAKLHGNTLIFTKATPAVPEGI